MNEHRVETWAELLLEALFEESWQEDLGRNGRPSTPSWCERS
jgi:hypothetical protein